MFRYLLLLSGLFTMLHAQVVQDEWIDPSVLEDDEVFRFKSIRSGDTSILSHIGDTSDLKLGDSLIVRKGYRVQILSTQDMQEADITARRAERLFEDPVYIVFESPYYKVRVGDFRNDLEAIDVERRARQNGYPRAWIVPSEINVPNTNRRYE
jgi:hypothetical protein